MTVRFLALHETPTDPEAFDRHYREVHLPLGRAAWPAPPGGAGADGKAPLRERTEDRALAERFRQQLPLYAGELTGSSPGWLGLHLGRQ